MGHADVVLPLIIGRWDRLFDHEAQVFGLEIAKTFEEVSGFAALDATLGCLDLLRLRALLFGDLEECAVNRSIVLGFQLREDAAAMLDPLVDGEEEFSHAFGPGLLFLFLSVRVGEFSEVWALHRAFWQESLKEGFQ